MQTDSDVDQYLNKAKVLVIKHEDRTDTDPERLFVEDIYIVWFSKVLQNWKALLSTNRPDDKYFEVTYNGDRLESYVDEYIKTSNTAISDINI